MQLSFIRNQRGSALLEFAFTAWVLIVLLFGCIQWALAMYAYHYTAYAAEQGVRFAMVRGYTWSQSTATNCSTSAPPSFTLPYACTASSTDIQNYVQSLGGMNPGGLTINTTNSYVWPGLTPRGSSAGCTQANSKGCLVKVTVNYKFNLLPFISATSMTMSATSEEVIAQ